MEVGCLKILKWNKGQMEKNKKPIAEQFSIHNFYKPSKDHANRYVWKRVPARILKKKGKKNDKKT